MPQTWHYGLVAKWWAEFNREGPEIPYFRRFVERGQPALDVACGTGRLLLPFLRAGLDVDGCDVSADMVAYCREAVEREGLDATLFVQPMHELDPPRTYRTIFVCGGFGLGSDHERDRQTLARFHEHLEPGGTLVLDNEVPYADAYQWRHWPVEERAQLPRPWRERIDRRRASDGSELGLQSRLVALDPLEQRVRMELRAYEWRDDVLVAEEEHAIDIGLYFTHELKLLIERAGFADVVVHGGHEERAPNADDAFVSFVATKSR